MSLAHRVKTTPVTTHGLPCSIGHLLENLKGAELDALRTMLGTHEKRGWPAADIHDALTAEGYRVGQQTINRHRAGRCRCGKP